MMINIFCITIILLIQLTYVFAQAPIVEDIEFIGYEKTKRYILEREIQHHINAPLDSTIAEADRLRLENTGIFSLVDMQVFTRDSDNVVIRYTVIEGWRFFPMLSPIYDEKWGWSVGAILMINNFRGRDETLIIDGQYGGQNSMGVEFNNPWIFGDHVSINFGIGSDIYEHTFLPYDVRNNYLQIGFGKYFGEHIRSKIGLSISDKRYWNDLIDTKYFHVIPHSNFVFDSRDLYTNPSKGLYSTQLLVFRIDAKGNRDNLLVWNNSTGWYHKLLGNKWRTVIGINLNNRFAFGEKNEIWYDYIGGAYTVRGWTVPNNKMYESNTQPYRFGMNWITSTIEIRQIVIPKFVTSLGNELGLSAVIFADVGTSANIISDLFDNQPISGLGVGIRIPWSVVGSIRLDYGWSFYNGKNISKGLHLAFGEKF